MSRPATMGSAASAATAVKDPPSWAASSSSAARSRATPTTRAPAPLKAAAMPRPKPRLAPVTRAVAPVRSLALSFSLSVMTNLLGSRRSAGGLADIDQANSRQSPRLRWLAALGGAVLPGQAERPEKVRAEERDDPRDPGLGDQGHRDRVREVRPAGLPLIGGERRLAVRRHGNEA